MTAHEDPTSDTGTPTGPPFFGENLCPECGGSGRLDEDACDTCGGSGKVTEPIGGE